MAGHDGRLPQRAREAGAVEGAGGAAEGIRAARGGLHHQDRALRHAGVAQEEEAAVSGSDFGNSNWRQLASGKCGNSTWQLGTTDDDGKL